MTVKSILLTELGMLQTKLRYKEADIIITVSTLL